MRQFTGIWASGNPIDVSFPFLGNGAIALAVSEPSTPVLLTAAVGVISSIPVCYNQCSPRGVRRHVTAPNCMNDGITRILAKIESGNAGAANELLPLVYEELRKLAEVRMRREKPGQTLQATALVHEAYLRLVGSDSDRKWDSRGHFFAAAAAAAEAMRRILLNQARDKKRQ